MMLPLLANLTFFANKCRNWLLFWLLIQKPKHSKLDFGFAQIPDFQIQTFNTWFNKWIPFSNCINARDILFEIRNSFDRMEKNGNSWKWKSKNQSLIMTLIARWKEHPGEKLRIISFNDNGISLGVRAKGERKGKTIENEFAWSI